MKRPQQSTGPHTPLRPTPAKKRRRGRKLAVVLPVILAGAAAVSVGAAAYSRDGDHDSAAGKAAAAAAAEAAIPQVVKQPLASDEAARGRAVDREIAAAAPGAATVQAPKLDTSTLKPAAAEAYRQIKVDAEAMTIGHDPSGVAQTSLPLHITNIGGQVRSFDITIAARDAGGATITKDTGTAANLQPGQSAEVRVLDIVNDAIVEKLRAATFAVTDVFAY